MSPIVCPAATPIEMAWCVRPRLAFIEPSIGSMTTSTSCEPKSTSPRSSLSALNLAPPSDSLSSSAKIASSAAWSMTSVWSPPSPRAPVSSTRSRLVGYSRRMRRSSAVALRDAPSQSADNASGRPVTWTYPRAVPRDLDALTPAQRAAVTHDGGPLLVLGGPGTGKTRVLVERFAWLVESGVAPEEILLVGGAPATTGLLRTQVEDAMEQPFGELAVHTVPDLAARLLREEPAAVGLDPFFVPVTAADRLALLLHRVDQLKLERHDFLGNRAALLASVIERIDRCKLELVTAEGYAGWAEQLDGEAAEREREFAQLFADHDRLLAEQGTLDVGDLVLRAIDLLNDAAAGARCRGRFAHLLVDEYEDLDLAHLRLIQLLGAHGNLTVAGDDDAAIKRFRGAATKNLRTFTATRPPARVIALDRSFRSR